MIKLNLPLKPVPKGRPRVGKANRVYTPPKTAKYEADIKALTSHLKPISGPISVDAIFILPRPKSTRKSLKTRFIKPTSKGDVDNYIKSLLDGLQGNAFSNDSQVVRVSGLKCYSALGEDAHVEVTIVQVTEVDLIPLSKEQRRFYNRLEHKERQAQKDAKAKADRESRLSKAGKHPASWLELQALKIATAREKLVK